MTYIRITCQYGMGCTSKENAVHKVIHIIEGIKIKVRTDLPLHQNPLIQRGIFQIVVAGVERAIAIGVDEVIRFTHLGNNFGIT